VAHADVVVENFRPGIMDKLGIGYEALSKINPKLIYCAISAMGQTGPHRFAPGFDGKLQALSGIMAITGHPSTGPTRAGFALCDIIAGSAACFGIASALYQATRSGRGQLIDVSMLEAALSFLTVEVAEATLTRSQSKLYGNSTPLGIPTAGTFNTADGELLLAVNFENQFVALMKSLELGHVLTEPRFSNWDTRRENGEDLQQLIEDALERKSAREWEEILDPAGAPCASIWKLEDVINHPQIAARGAIQQLTSPLGPLRFAGVGFKLREGGGRLDRMAPRLGEHSSEILQSAGYSQGEIETLREQSVI
jgi:crotonobetainyl-CoA:carnitine CoA-transferase CaiB-like acyl-CoA transferase